MYIYYQVIRGKQINIYLLIFTVRKPKDTSVSPKKKGKKGKKKNPWSDSEESAGEMSDSDLDGSFMEHLKPKVDRPKRETSKQENKYKKNPLQILLLLFNGIECQLHDMTIGSLVLVLSL